MGAAIKAGVILGVAVTLVSALLIGSGMHQNLVVNGVVSLVIYIGLNIGLLIWALRKTAADSGYGKQLLNALIVGVVGSVLIFAGSYLLLGVIFPDAVAETRDVAVVFLENANVPEQQLAAQIAKLEAATPVSQSLAGVWGTLGTTLIVGAVAAIFIRRK